MKGLVLAGGCGTRLRPLTYSGAKQLVPVANKPILHYVIENLADANIEEIVVVISPETGAEVRASLGDGARWGVKLDYVVQDRPGGLAHAVLAARTALGNREFCMFLGDNLIGTKIRDAATHFRTAPELSASVMLIEVADPSRFGVAELDASGRLVGLVEKPKEPRSNLALVGIYFFRSLIFDAIARIAPSPRGELEITDAISKLMELGGEVHCEKVASWWLDTGKKDDLLLANETVLRDWLEPASLGEIDPESRLVGPVRIERGASVVRSTIEGPAIIGRGARLVDCHIGPFTAIGDEVVVTASGIAQSVVMQGARIEGVTLERSLVGRRVIVRPGKALSLLVGDDCVVEVAKRGPTA